MRHPPCEDVSWKIIPISFLTLLTVILLVRMWVENGKYTGHGSKYSVILLVRMWVEKIPATKLFGTGKVILLVRMWVEKSHAWSWRKQTKSSSMWGCELKIWITTFCSEIKKSSSMWGCELKILICAFPGIPRCHPPCEDVSWKENDVKMYGTQV